MSESIQIGPGQFLEVLESSEHVLVLETTYAPGGSPPPAHFHPAQAEHFEILAGAVHVEVDGRRRQLATGERLDIPPNTAHRMWNPSGEAARARWETRPAGRTEQWFRGLGALQGTNWVNADGQPKPLAFAALASEYQDSFRLAGPQWLIRPALVAASAIARLRGFSAPRA
ncbi:MAG: cupin domain-containing protein [Solirubrobacterales bacterium]|nr:cupin domain-containing protein [Solirubrobacterales bacterium]